MNLVHQLLLAQVVQCVNQFPPAALGVLNQFDRFQIRRGRIAHGVDAHIPEAALASFQQA